MRCNSTFTTEQWGRNKPMHIAQLVVVLVLYSSGNSPPVFYPLLLVHCSFGDPCNTCSTYPNGSSFFWNHTHPFNGPLSGTTRVSRYQKGKTNLDFTEAWDSQWQWHQLVSCKSAPSSRQIATPAPHHSVFYRPDALPVAQPTASVNQ